MSSRLLVIDDDTAICRTLQLHFRNDDMDVLVAHSAEQGQEICDSQDVDLIILDIRMSGKSGLDILPELKTKHPAIGIIMITAFHDMESTIAAMQSGADDYIHKPIDLDELDLAVTRALTYSNHTGGDIGVSTADDSFDVMVGHSRKMLEVFKMIGRIASSPATVLITGESGTGKELVARALHRTSSNAGPFVVVNCAALVETLLESDLFGHEKGAFTGAFAKHIGKFALADQGTIFLDEISELSLAMQAKLLRVLQEGEFSPIGSTVPQKTNVRVVAATNTNLLEALEQSHFREDLYYRLQVVNIHLPPLRDRIDDVPALVQHLLARISASMNRSVERVSLDAIDTLKGYHWPGNVRELENVITKAVSMCPANTITREILPELASVPADNESKTTPLDQDECERSLLEVEKAHIARVLENTNWHKGKACEILGVSRPRLRRLIALHGIEPPLHLHRLLSN